MVQSGLSRATRAAAHIGPGLAALILNGCGGSGGGGPGDGGMPDAEPIEYGSQAIDCLRVDDPTVESDGYMLNVAPGSTVTVPVGTTDTYEEQVVTLNGTQATLHEDGYWAADMQVQFGMNFVEVVAQDSMGGENLKTCMFLVSDRWVGEDAFLDDSVTLRLDQDAVDDGNTGDVDSLNDILYTFLNSQELRDSFDQMLEDANPLASQGCVVSTGYVNYEGGLSYGADTSVDLVNGGLDATLRITDFSIDASITGCGCGTSGTITMDELAVDVGFWISLQGGEPDASVDSLSIDITGTGSNFEGGICAALANAAASSVGTVETLAGDLIDEQVRQQLEPALDDVLAGLDLSNLGTGFGVPKLDGSGTVDLDLGVRLSTVDPASDHILFGFGTQITPAMTAHDLESLGVALRQGPVMLDPPGTSVSAPVGVAVYEGMLNQVLHALWRGGFFTGTIPVDDEITVTLDSLLPPVAVLDGGQMRLMIGGLKATVEGIGAEPVHVTLGAVASAAVRIEGSDLVFSEVTVDELHVSFDVNLDPTVRMLYEAGLTNMVTMMLDRAVNEGLPAVPLPSFNLPSQAGGLALPGGELGITNPSLTSTDHHFVLTGGFDLQ